MTKEPKPRKPKVGETGLVAVTITKVDDLPEGVVVVRVTGMWNSVPFVVSIDAIKGLE